MFAQSMRELNSEAQLMVSCLARCSDKQMPYLIAITSDEDKVALGRYIKYAKMDGQEVVVSVFKTTQIRWNQHEWMILLLNGCL
jgi:hypothetical protein